MYLINLWIDWIHQAASFFRRQRGTKAEAGARSRTATAPFTTLCLSCGATIRVDLERRNWAPTLLALREWRSSLRPRRITIPSVALDALSLKTSLVGQPGDMQIQGAQCWKGTLPFSLAHKTRPVEWPRPLPSSAARP